MLVRNKYMRWGIWAMLTGGLFYFFGWLIMVNKWGWYGGAMLLGVLLFVIGFLLFFYSLLRKIDRRSLLRERSAENIKSEEQKNAPNKSI